MRTTVPQGTTAVAPVSVSGCELSLRADGILRCTLVDVDRDDLAAVRDFLRAVVATGGGPRTPILVEWARPPRVVQAERLVYLASTEAAALAVVDDDTALAAQLASLAAAHCPARACASRRDAERWLAGYVTPMGGRLRG
jgi:hypothetical protein